MSKLEYFINKPCTVFTSPTNRNFKEENPQTFPAQVLAYFTGFIESIDDIGIMLRGVNNKKTFLFMHNVVGIAEEEVELPKQTFTTSPTPLVESDEYVNPSKMTALAKELKKQYGK